MKNRGSGAERAVEMIRKLTHGLEENCFKSSFGKKWDFGEREKYTRDRRI